MLAGLPDFVLVAKRADPASSSDFEYTAPQPQAPGSLPNLEQGKVYSVVVTTVDGRLTSKCGKTGQYSVRCAAWSVSCAACSLCSVQYAGYTAHCACPGVQRALAAYNVQCAIWSAQCAVRSRRDAVYSKPGGEHVVERVDPTQL